MRESVETLLLEIVDYAGLFPPAKLDMQAAIANYIQAQHDTDHWMVSRFLLPISRLDEFSTLLPANVLQRGSVSAILTGKSEVELAQVRSFNAQNSHVGNSITITSLEFSPLSPDVLATVLPQLPIGIEAFFEIPLNQNLEPYLAILKRFNVGAKIRTGGITIDAFPAANQLAETIMRFAEAQIPFKATAGLHHPLPAKYPLTYESNSPKHLMYGFLNLAILAALAHQKRITRVEAIEVLKTPTIDQFSFTKTGISWQRHYLHLSEIQVSRQKFFRSFGSCSIQEPLNDLKHLHLL